MVPVCSQSFALIYLYTQYTHTYHIAYIHVHIKFYARRHAHTCQPLERKKNLASHEESELEVWRPPRALSRKDASS